VLTYIIFSIITYRFLFNFNNTNCVSMIYSLNIIFVLKCEEESSTICPTRTVFVCLLDRADFCNNSLFCIFKELPLKTCIYLFVTFYFLCSLFLSYFFLLDCISYLLQHICLSVTRKICLALLDIKWDILFMFLYLNNAMTAHSPLTCEDFQQ